MRIASDENWGSEMPLAPVGRPEDPLLFGKTLGMFDGVMFAVRRKVVIFWI